jgi:hypothetical protein
VRDSGLAQWLVKWLAGGGHLKLEIELSYSFDWRNFHLSKKSIKL